MATDTAEFKATGFSFDEATLAKLDTMATADQRSRSAEVRFLVMQEWARREAMAKAEASNG